MKCLSRFFTATTVVLLLVNAVFAQPLTNIPDRTYVTDGQVKTIVRAGNTIYIAGLFNRVGPRTGPGVELALSGSQNPGLPEISGAGPSAVAGAGNGLSAVVTDGSGGWYVGGRFNHVGGVLRTNLAHIRTDRSVDPSFNPIIDGIVNSLAVSGSTVYVGGRFTSISGQTRNNIAALNAADGSVTAFNPNASAAANANAEVLALAVSSDGLIVYAGGRFTLIGGQSRNKIAALNAATGTATLTFDPNPNTTATVNAFAISDSILYVGGNFNVMGGVSRNMIAALSLRGPNDGVAVPGFNPSPTYFGIPAAANIAALAVSGSTVFAGGSFDMIGGQPRLHVAALNASNGTVTAFNANLVRGNILALAVSGSTLYIAGGFTSSDGTPSIGGQARNYVAGLNVVDGTATGFNPNPNASVRAFGVSGSAVYMGGLFSSLGGVVRRSIAAINAADGTPTSWDPNAAGFNGGSATIAALAVSGSTIYVGGFFSSIGGQPRASIAALNAADGLATTWDPSVHSGATGNANVFSLAVGDGGSTIYAGGGFNTIGGQSRVNIAAISAATGTVTTWNPNPDGSVNAIVVSGGLVYAGGSFLHIGVGFTPRTRIAALNASDGTATSWDPDAGPTSGILALAVSGSTIYAGGNFTLMGGLPRNNIAGINASDGTPTSFNPNASDGSVEALAVDGSTVYAGGRFSVIGGQSRGLLAGLNAGDGSATSFNPNASSGTVFALAVASNGTLYVGGSFTTFDFAYQQGFAQFSSGQTAIAEQRKDHVTSAFRATVTNEGTIGSLNAFVGTGPGSGFQFNPVSTTGQRLFGDGIMVALDSVRVSDGARTGAGVYDADFKFLTTIDSSTSGSRTTMTTSYTDSLAETPFGVRVNQRTVSWDSAGLNNFLIFELDAVNTSATAWTTLHVGGLLDWDVESAGNDRGAVIVDSTNTIPGVNGGNPFAFDMLEMHQGATPNSWMGVVPLHENRFRGRRIAISSSEIYAPHVTNGDKWRYMTGNRATNPNGDGGSTQDHAQVFGVGPYSVAAGATKRVGFAMFGGTSLANAVAAARAAQRAWVQRLGNTINVIIVGVDEAAGLPDVFELAQNYPNPFNPSTTIRYALPEAANVKLHVYNLLGQQVATLTNEVHNAGYYDVVWNGRNQTGAQVATGVYFYRIEATPVNGGAPFISLKKALLLK